MPQRSGFAAALAGKCPQCRVGKMFPYSSTNVSKFMRMNEQCPKCNLRFEVEPGFFIGAMYFSYAVTVALLIAVGIALYVLNMSTLTTYLVTIVVINVLLLPFIFRYSRVAFLYMFGGVEYKGAGT